MIFCFVTCHITLDPVIWTKPITAMVSLCPSELNGLSLPEGPVTRYPWHLSLPIELFFPTWRPVPFLQGPIHAAMTTRCDLLNGLFRRATLLSFPQTAYDVLYFNMLIWRLRKNTECPKFTWPQSSVNLEAALRKSDSWPSETHYIFSLLYTNGSWNNWFDCIK